MSIIHRDPQKRRLTRDEIDSEPICSSISAYLMSDACAQLRNSLMMEIAEYTVRSWMHKCSSSQTDYLRSIGLLAEAVGHLMVLYNRHMMDELFMKFDVRDSFLKSSTPDDIGKIIKRPTLNQLVECVYSAVQNDRVNIFIGPNQSNKSQLLDAMRDVYKFRNMVSHPLSDRVGDKAALKEHFAIDYTQLIISSAFPSKFKKIKIIVEEIISDTENPPSDLQLDHIIRLLRDLMVSDVESMIIKKIASARDSKRIGIRKRSASNIIIALIVILSLCVAFVVSLYLYSMTESITPNPQRVEQVAEKRNDIIDYDGVLLSIFSSMDRWQREPVNSLGKRMNIKSSFREMISKIRSDVRFLKDDRDKIKKNMKTNKFNTHSQHFVNLSISAHISKTIWQRIKPCYFFICENPQIRIIQDGKTCQFNYILNATASPPAAPSSPPSITEPLCIDATATLFIEVEGQGTCPVGKTGDSVRERLDALVAPLPSPCHQVKINLEIPDLEEQLARQNISLDDMDDQPSTRL